MSLGQARWFVVLGGRSSLLAYRNKLVAPATFEGHRKLSTDPSVYHKKPFPYKTKHFGILQTFLDFTSSRLNDNSRIIVVEGAPCTGKTELAKNIAKEFNLEYLPTVNEDNLWDFNGFDMRELNDVYSSPNLRILSLKDFYSEPDVKKMQRFGTTQMRYFAKKYVQYRAALLHLLHTGQGVVLENSIFSDGVYAELLYKSGYFTRNGFRYYKRFRKNVICDLWKPHLVVHLDAPTGYIIDKMKNKYPECADSPVLTEKYVSTMQDLYRDKFLPHISKSSEILSYDVTDMPDFDLLSLDLEKLDLIYEQEEYPDRFKDWRKQKEEQWSSYRYDLNRVDNSESQLIQRPPIDCPELMNTGVEVEEMCQVRDRVPQLSHYWDFFHDADGNWRDTPEIRKIMEDSVMAPAKYDHLHT